MLCLILLCCSSNHIRAQGTVNIVFTETNCNHYWNISVGCILNTWAPTKNCSEVFMTRYDPDLDYAKDLTATTRESWRLQSIVNTNTHTHTTTQLCVVVVIVVDVQYCCSGIAKSPALRRGRRCSRGSRRIGFSNRTGHLASATVLFIRWPTQR